MAYYHTCPRCGASLDPCERCDCSAHLNGKESVKQKEEDKKNISVPRRNYYARFSRKTRQRKAN